MLKIIKNNGKNGKENSFGDPFKKSTLCIQKVNKTTHKAKNNKKKGSSSRQVQYQTNSCTINLAQSKRVFRTPCS